MCTGSFRPTTGTRHLHRDYSFTGSLVETVPKSLRHSCRSELRVHPPFPEAQTIPSPWRTKGRRLIELHGFALRQWARSHVPVRTISRSGVRPVRSTSPGITLRYDGTLYAAYEEGFPVISRCARRP